eukprot:gnl/MRDRNA2_/MRDRNA2_99981_c0_seq1.p1 gnl/MRDRNA2_/MRDRNA2_99981_c0~~gnl/MRDRNA2_/MRDRNA2_99981_c0_seq1.p1  ORF type:complete len:254 (+),score=77.25 gnl/MRDRNA2_/MRDRNA2_99981_c0_seq1:79-840(+)
MADALEAEAIRQEFLQAYDLVGTQAARLNLSETVQRRLFGLYCRATRGVAPQGPEDDDDGSRQQWEAWHDVSELSELEAMSEYVDLVNQHDTDGQGVFVDEPCGELPPEVRKQLEMAGMRPATSPGGQAGGSAVDVFTAAREADPRELLRFLPGQVDAVDSDGLTPLIHAVDGERIESVKALLEAGASVNLSDSQGSSPLHYAALLGASDIVSVLLDAGADAKQVDEDGVTPADAARGEGHHELAEMLAKAAS